MTDARSPLVYTHAELRPFNTFALPCRAQTLVEIQTVEQLIHWLKQTPRSSTAPYWILGGGSNIVLPPDLSGTVLKVDIHQRALIRETSDAFYIEAGAGENWHDFVQWTLANGWNGLENLAYIPGTVGAAPVQNIGAYGLELCDRFEALEAIHLYSGETRHFDRQACDFAYRHSVFKTPAGRDWLIVRVRFRLSKNWQPSIGYADLSAALTKQRCGTPSARDIAAAIIHIRQQKLPDPTILGNAGSFFKNPVINAERAATLQKRHPDMPCFELPEGQVKLSAGWLIQHCGWKGKRLGPAGCYAKQALILVNHHNATGHDILKLAAQIQRDVQKYFAIELSIEPALWGCLQT